MRCSCCYIIKEGSLHSEVAQRQHWPRTCHLQSRLFHRLLFFPSHREKIRLHVINHDYIKIISYPRCFEQPVHRSSSRLWCAPGSSHSLQAHRAHIVGTNPSHNHYSTTSHRINRWCKEEDSRCPEDPSPSTLHIRISAIPTSHLRARRCCRRRSSINLQVRLCTPIGGSTCWTSAP